MIVALDTENTTFNKGSPFDKRNYNVCVAYATDDESGALFGEYDKIKSLIEKATLLVFFNAKYDIHWLRKLGMDVREKKLWCCQLFHFFHNRMTTPYPSLEDVANHYGLGTKQKDFDWSIGTENIPRETLAKYAIQDVNLTLQIFKKQVSEQREHQKALFRVQMLDLVALADMEWNGSVVDFDAIKRESKKVEEEIINIQKNLNLFHSVPEFNWASGDHLSALLYGGDIKIQEKVPNGFYKTGAKAGQPKFKNVEKVYHLPRIFKPPKGSELKKTGFFSTEDSVLAKLKPNDSGKQLLEGIKRLRELNKLNSTYYKGLRELYEKMNWKDNKIHTQFNQVVARTGRLSSTSPNLQNLHPEVQRFFISREEACSI